MSRAPSHTSVSGGPAGGPELPPQGLPRHLAIIMDGNGRWAKQRNQPRIAGHRAGAKAVRDVVIECDRLGVRFLTVYSFSSENWKRPAGEVRSLMGLYCEYLVKERQELLDNDIRFLQLGRREGLPKSVLEEVDETVAATGKCRGLTLCLALNYGSRTEITEATQRGGLPENARRYLDRIEELVGVPIEIISVGPERTQTLVKV